MASINSSLMYQSINPIDVTTIESIDVSDSSNKIVVVGSTYDTLEKIRSFLKSGKIFGAGFLGNKIKENILLQTFKTPFSDSSIGTVDLLTIPTDKISEEELKKCKEFQSKALNIILVDRSISRIPAPLLESMKSIENIRTVFIFERNLQPCSISKHVQNISSYILNSFPYFIETGNTDFLTSGKFRKIVTYSNDQCLTQANLNESIDNIDNSDRDILRLQKLQNVQKELNLVFLEGKSCPNTFSELHLDCYIQEKVLGEDREKAIESLKKIYLEALNKLTKELDELDAKTTRIFGESNVDLSLEERCRLKAEEIESVIYNAGKVSREGYINRVKALEIMRGRYDYVNLQKPLGKRSRKEVWPPFDTPDAKKTQSKTQNETVQNETVQNDYRNQCIAILKEVLISVYKEVQEKHLELNAKIKNMLGQSNAGLSLEERSVLKVQESEKQMFTSSYGYKNDYATMYQQELGKIAAELRKTKVACPSKPIGIKGYAGKVFMGRAAPTYEIRYDAPCPLDEPRITNEVMFIKNQSGEVIKAIPSIVRIGPEELMNKWRSGESKAEVLLPGYPSKLTVDFKNSTLTTPKGAIVEGLHKIIKFNNQEINYPSYWEGFQERPLKVFPLKSDSEVYELYEQEVKKIDPNAILKKVIQIQDIANVNMFEFKWCEIQQIRKNFAIFKECAGEFKAEVEKRVGSIVLKKERDDKLYAHPLCLYFSVLDTPPEAIIGRDGIPMDSIKVDPNRHWGINSIQLSESILHADRTSFTTHNVGEGFVTKRIFVCEALLGISAKYDEYCTNLKRPPERGSINGMPYHYTSIRGTDHELGVEVHNVFDERQILLRHMIEYTVPIKDINPSDSK